VLSHQLLVRYYSATGVYSDNETSSPASVFRYAIAQAVPCLIEMFRNPDHLANRPSILVYLSDLMAAARDSVPAVTQSSHKGSPLVLPFKAQIFSVEVASLKCSTCRLAALGGIKEMVATKALLTDYELGVIVDNANGILEIDSDHSDARYSQAVSG
jgi:DNA repair/transcription protein MET18/MMS19